MGAIKTNNECSFSFELMFSIRLQKNRLTLYNVSELIRKFYKLGEFQKVRNKTINNRVDKKYELYLHLYLTFK